MLDLSTDRGPAAPPRPVMSAANLAGLARMLAAAEAGVAEVVAAGGEGEVTIRLVVCQRTLRRPVVVAEAVTAGTHREGTVRRLQPWPTDESVAAALERVRMGR